MSRTILYVVVATSLALVGLAGGGRSAGSSIPFVSADTPIDAGRYLIVVGGCNDCHTPEWGPTDGRLDQSKWLTGSRVGSRGPWGTSYARNLRLVAVQMNDAQWVQMCRHPAPDIKHPPMPWENLRGMSRRDLVVMHQFIVSLGGAGQPVPDFVLPGQEPTAAYRTSTVVPAKTP